VPNYSVQAGSPLTLKGKIAFVSGTARGVGNGRAIAVKLPEDQSEPGTCDGKDVDNCLDLFVA
jgi:hypothetical protein